MYLHPMKNALLLLSALAAFTMCQTSKNNSPNGGDTDAAARYATLCASCHGEQGAGFVSRSWKHGSTKPDVVKMISVGNLEGGMPGFGATLKPAEIEALADYVLDAPSRADRYDFAESNAPKSNIFKSSSMTVRLDTVLRGIGSPWGLAFLPNGDMLCTERGGVLYRLAPGGQPRPVAGVPPVLAEGQGGLLDVELHPKFAENSLIYLSYSKFRDSSGSRYNTTAVFRARLDGDRLVDGRDIFVARPWSRTTYHFGSRLEFDRAGYLFVTVGERNERDKHPQSLDSDCGKIHRMRDDGTALPDNPFAKTHPAHATIWSWGHRNPQGLAMQPETGEMWAHEHGPRGGDEVNRILPGRNYGWPVITYGINYNGTIITTLTAQEGMEQPLKYWVPSIAPCGMVFVTGDRYPAWSGDLLVGSLRFKYLDRCIVRNGQITGDELLLQNLGRLRCVAMDREGYLYVGVEEPGFVFKLVPVAQ